MLGLLSSQAREDPASSNNNEPIYWKMLGLLSSQAREHMHVYTNILYVQIYMHIYIYSIYVCISKLKIIHSHLQLAISIQHGNVHSSLLSSTIG